jgi:hypothetical protein
MRIVNIIYTIDGYTYEWIVIMNDDVYVPPELRPPRGMAAGVGTVVGRIGGRRRLDWRKEIDGNDGCMDRSRRALVAYIWLMLSFNLYYLYTSMIIFFRKIQTINLGGIWMKHGPSRLNWRRLTHIILVPESSIGPKIILSLRTFILLSLNT